MFLSNGAVVPGSIDVVSDRSPMLTSGTYIGGNSIPLSGYFAAYSAIYKQQLWVGTVIRKLARGQARLPFEVWLNQSGPGKSLEHGNLADLLARPNPRFTGFKLWEWTSSVYDIYGEAFWLKLRDQNGRVRELHPMHPNNVMIRRNDEGDLEYVWTLGTRSATELPGIPWDDVVPFASFSPDDTKRGLSNLEGLRMTLLNEDASRRATASFWNRGARPSVVLKHPKQLSDAAFARLKDSFDANHAGPDNRGGTNILEEGLDIEIIQLNLEEMQYIESRKLNREEVCGAYDVPPPAVHILDHATFSNITEQLRSMYRDTMAPRSAFFESVINEHLVTDFYSFGDAFTNFNMDEVLRGDFETRATAVAALVQTGVYKPSEARPLFNLPPAGPEADVLYGNAALVPLGSVGQQSQQVATDGTLIPQALPQKSIAQLPEFKSTPVVSLRSIMGRLSRKESKADVKKQLVVEHEKALSSFFDRQKTAVKAAVTRKAAEGFKPADWDDELGDLLHTLSLATAKAIGSKVAKQLGGSYNGDAIEDYLKTNAADTAVKINQATLGELQKAFAPADDDDEEGDDVDPEDLVDDVFDGQVSARASQISLSRVATIAGLASLVAARQSSARTKTWVVTSGNPRSSHAEMDGETVGIDESFSNGMDGPGDYTGGADEVAGCTCDLEFSVEDNS